MANAVSEYLIGSEGAYIFYGNPVCVVPMESGSLSVFEDGELVIYVRHIGRLYCAWIFRFTFNGDAAIPGVEGSVRLLAQARTRGKLSRLTKVFAALDAWHIRVDMLSEGFFLRLGVLLDSRIFRVSQLKRILSHEKL